MADVTETYSLNFETNAQKATGLVSELEKTLSEMGRSGELATNGLNSASRGVLSIEKALGSSTLSVKKYSDSFSNLRKEVSQATEALQDAAQAYVVGGGTEVLGSAAKTMDLGTAKEVLAIQRAEGLTAEQVASEVVAANKRKEQAQQSYEDAMRSGMARLERIQKSRTDEENAAELQHHNQKMQRLQEEVQRETAAVEKILAERAKLNQENAKAYQQGFTDPQSFLGQANSRDASTGLKASETSWAQAAKGQQAFRDELNRTEISFQEQARAAELAALKNRILARYTDEAGDSAERTEEGYVALRYALYDVGRTALTASAAITGTGVAALTAFASQERAFTEVERIAEGSVEEVQHLRKELMDMSTEIPRSFQELSEIASLGGALGIDSTALDEFTNTVAKFVTLTGVAEEAATTGFGRISQYLSVGEEDYDSLGSAILRAGNISVATEEQVLKFSSAIALPAARAGLLADEVVALGAATASFANINVEGAGSAFSRVFADIERAVSEGGESLDEFAGAAGYSSEQFKIAWGSDAGGTFNRIIQSLSQNVDGLVGNLDTLGIRNERDRRVVSALALNYEDYMRIVGETSNAWRDGIYMNEAYGLVLDDLVSKWTIFTNALTNAAASVGASIAPAMKNLLDVSTNVIVALSDFAQTPAGEAMARMAATAGVLAAAALAVGGALAIAGASGLALRFALQQVAASGMITAFTNLGKAIVGVGNSSGYAAGLAVGLGNAFRYVLRATIIGAALYAVSEAIFNTGEAAMKVGNIIIEFSNFLRDAGQAINDFFGVTALATDDPVYKFFRDSGVGIRDWGASLDSSNKKVQDFSGGQLGLNKAMEEFNGEIPEATENTGDFGDAAEEAAEKVYTLTDYANDLSSVWKRAFDIRFGAEGVADGIADSFQKLKDQAEASAQKVRDLKTSIQSLSADKNSLKAEIGTLEHFLRIATEYKDTARVVELEAELGKKRAELAKVTNDLSDKQKDLKKEQDSQSKSLTGNTQAARDNRDTIRDLVSKYQEQIEKLAASGLSQDELRRKTTALREDFIKQATQLGFNRAELSKYTKGFQDVKVAIDKVPRNITIKANADPALQAFAEFKTKADSASKSLNSLRNNVSKGVGSMPTINTYGARQQAMQARLNAAIALMESYRKAKDWGNMRSQDDFVERLRSQLANGNFYTGGFTGQGGKYEPAGIVHKGEYVVPKHQVNQRTGMPYASALGQLMGGIPSTARPARGTTSSSGTSGTVDLSAHTIQQLARVVQTNIMLDGRIVGEAASNSYVANTRVGAA